MYNFVGRNFVTHNFLTGSSRYMMIKKLECASNTFSLLFKYNCLLFSKLEVCVSRGYSISYLKKNQNAFCGKYSFSCSALEESDNDQKEDKQYEEIVKRAFRLPEMGHQVFVIQPYIKWGHNKKTITTPELQLSESVALINTLPNWKVILSKTVSLMSLRRPAVFGKGNLKLFAEMIEDNKDITAVFLSINMLNPEQQKALEDAFKVPIFDRYSIVIQIFKLHAITKEAKLQVAMGELPYLWSRLKHDNEDVSDKMGGGATIGGPGESWIEIKKRLLQNKEKKIKNELKKLKSQRELLRSKRQKVDIPTVAVVGYTNAGKTSIIKILTREESLQPKNVLFATLDVTVHAGFLPCGLKVLFVDTVGFLSDIPTNLIQSFIATLEDAVQADLILHIQDISHPDLKAQNQHVMDTLKSMNLPDNLLKTMITVGNKVDLVTDPLSEMGTSFPVSAATGVGLDALKRKLEESIIKATGQILITIRIPNGGPEYVWLHKEATIVKATVDENDSQFALLNTIITEANLNKFKHKFISSKVKRG